jgi:hypothetical protein
MRNLVPPGLALLLLNLAFFPFVAWPAEPQLAKNAAAFAPVALQLLDSAACRETALAAEKARDWPAALAAWERTIDRSPASNEQLTEARAHIKQLRPKVPRNTDPEKAHPWKVLVVIFRQLDFSWVDNKQNKIEVHKTVSTLDEQKMRRSLAAFAGHVFHYSSGRLRLDMDFAVITEPLTKLEGKGKGPFSPAPHLLRPYIGPLVKDKSYDTVMAYVKYNGDQGPAVPAPFTAATLGSADEVKGAGFIMVPWHTNYPYPGETDGEMELHEFLHQIEFMFGQVLHYPAPILQNPDGGRIEGEKRPGGDPEYARRKDETTWIRFYQHIMEDHYTRQMWSEATMHPPAGQPLPGDILKPKK